MADMVIDLVDDESILRFLEGDRLWAAYGICDLEPAHRGAARYLASLIDGEPVALVLVFAPPSFTALLSFGDQQGVERIVAATADLPDSADLVVRTEHVAAFRRRYTVYDLRTMHRMTITPRAIHQLPPDPRVEPLTAADWPALLRLYDDWTGRIFGPAMPEGAIYFGVRQGSELIAVANTHAISYTHSIATVGGVFTRKEHRGRGLATATTAAVTLALAEAGINDIVLNVQSDNLPAVAAYGRIGYTTYLDYCEGVVSSETGEQERRASIRRRIDGPSSSRML